MSSENKEEKEEEGKEEKKEKFDPRKNIELNWKKPILGYVEQLPDSGLWLDHPNTVPILFQEFSKYGTVVLFKFLKFL